MAAEGPAEGADAEEAEAEPPPEEPPWAEERLMRNKTFIAGHVGQMIFSGFMFGALYWQQPVDVTGGLTKISLIYMVTLTIALGTFQLINAIMQGRAVYYKQKSEHFFPPWTYIVGASAVTSLSPFHLGRGSRPHLRRSSN